MTKACSKCRRVLPVDQFYLDRGIPRAKCKDCSRREADSWRVENRERYLSVARANRAKRWRDASLATYGITAEDYEEMLARQGGKCCVCGGLNRGRRLAVDHDHETGRVRGLLCNRCNTAIGLLREDPDLLAEALVYLVGPTASADFVVDAGLRTAISCGK